MWALDTSLCVTLLRANVYSTVDLSMRILSVMNLRRKNDVEFQPGNDLVTNSIVKPLSNRWCR